MIPRTVQMAKAVEATFTTSDLENYGNIILNGYLDTSTAVSAAGTVGAIDTVTFTGGTNYTNGTYPNTYLGGAVGSFGYATVTVSGGAVTGVTVTAGGSNFFVGQVLTLGNIPRTAAGTSATVTVATVNTKSVRPALKGWTTNYYDYYTELPPNAYNVNPGDPTMFEYDVHSYTFATGPITSLTTLGAGSGYLPGTYTGLPTAGGSGTGATLNVTVDADGYVTAASINAAGSGYTAGDGLTVTAGMGSGTGFFVTVGPIGGPITALQVGTTGTGYTPGSYTAVTTTTNGVGSGATLDIIVGASGSITSVILNAAGTGYAAGDALIPDPTTIGAGTGLVITVTSVSTATDASEPKWSQAPRRFFQNQVADFVPPNANQQAIQYSFMYPVQDNPVAPPIGTL